MTLVGRIRRAEITQQRERVLAALRRDPRRLAVRGLEVRNRCRGLGVVLSGDHVAVVGEVRVALLRDVIREVDGTDLLVELEVDVSELCLCGLQRREVATRERLLLRLTNGSRGGVGLPPRRVQV